MWYPIYKQLLNTHFDLERRMHAASPMNKVMLQKQCKSIQRRVLAFQEKYQNEIFHDDFNEFFESYDRILSLRAVEPGIFICYRDYMISIFNPDSCIDNNDIHEMVIDTINSHYPSHKQIGYISYRKYPYTMTSNSVERVMTELKTKPVSVAVVCGQDMHREYALEREEFEPHCTFDLFTNLNDAVSWTKGNL